MKKIKILIAEDDLFLQKAYDYSLRNKGYEVITANNGLEVLEKIDAGIPDIIILDLLMPKKNGLETLQEIKQKPETKKLPVFILSNSDNEFDFQKMRDLGATKVLIKAKITIEELTGHIEETLNHSKQ